MKGTTTPDRFHNPFATRHVKPGALAYRFAAGESAAKLCDRFVRCGGRGQIVGPHGSGKSSLLATLVEELSHRGYDCRLCALHDGQRRLPHALPPARSWSQQTIVIIDGYEQLNARARWGLLWRCRRRSAGLLVTAHANVGLPMLASTHASLSVVESLVQELLGFRNGVSDSAEAGGSSGAAFAELGRLALAARLAARGDNVREVLFDLYDLFERQPGLFVSPPRALIAEREFAS